MGSTLLRCDGDDPEQQEGVQVKQATGSRRGGAPAGPDVKRLRNRLDRGGTREEYEVEKVVYLRDKQGEQRRWGEITQRTSSHKL